MTREEFHRVYEMTPEHVRAELIGGIVYMASPLKRPHATNHPPLSSVLFIYESRTPGVETGDNGTILLGDDSEPQPDLYLRILPAFGGQSRDDAEYVAGAPELVAEIAHSSRAIDLHGKKDDYTRNGVIEYVVFLVAEKQLRWFDLRAGTEFVADTAGVFRSAVFPGLWIDSRALVARDADALLATLNTGLATPEHSAFIGQLSARRPS
jgi:hypothetical protein